MSDEEVIKRIVAVVDEKAGSGAGREAAEALAYHPEILGKIDMESLGKVPDQLWGALAQLREGRQQLEVWLTENPPPHST